MITPIFNGTVTKGVFVCTRPDDYRAYVCTLEGKNVEVTIKVKGVSRSRSQNRYLWGVVYKILAMHTGHQDEEIHDICRIKFLSEKDDKGLIMLKSTTKLTTAEFGEYVDAIKMWASEYFGCYIPDPGEVE